MIRPSVFGLTCLAVCFGLAVNGNSCFGQDRHPNIVFIFIDDMGYGDLSCTGNQDVQTTNLDRLAAEGIRLTQFYVNSPICSPSRVACTTGQYPARHLINSYLNSRERNRQRGMANFLDPQAPCVASAFQQAGYATAHFGKWHMGGGRDVDDAPLPQAYGFDESLASFEGLGDRLLPPGGLSRQSEALGRGEVRHVQKHEMTGIYVDRSIDFIQRNKDRPFYLHLWLNDVHDGHNPSDEQLKPFENTGDNPFVRKFYAVLAEMDRQLGRLIGEIDRLGLGEETLIVVTSDNGPTAWPRYDKSGYDAPGSTAGMRGRKWSLYEGGIRMPLIARWRGKIPAGVVDETSVMAAVDLFPTFCELAEVPAPQVAFDGVAMGQSLLGKPQQRSQPIMWEYGRDASYLQPARPLDRSPNLAIRDGNWKLLVNDDGSRLELYDLSASGNEFENVAGEQVEVARRLSSRLLGRGESLPALNEQDQVEVATSDKGSGHLVTRWAGDVDPSNVLPEYPRPQMVRDKWLNLNGYWQYAIRPKDQTQPEKFDGRILVPYPIESILSGVQKRVDQLSRLWYRRTFTVPQDWDAPRTLLHFGAVDWKASVWVNGIPVGDHQGGYDPFSFDITDALQAGEEQELVVGVWDPTDTGSQPRGKQVKDPRGIWYTPVTGIWQTVWIEPVPEIYIQRMRLVPLVDSNELLWLTEFNQRPPTTQTTFRVQSEGKTIAEVISSEESGLLPIRDPRLWTPDDPFLYDLTVETAQGDRVTSYFGMRKISRGKGPNGFNRLLLNDKPMFQYGPLDQGWWPDGLYTAPTDEALRFDIEMTKKLGFNTARKHVKVEPARWYYWCDRLGLMVWQDMPSGFRQGSGQAIRPNQPGDATFAPEEMLVFSRELSAMIRELYNSPCIVAWVPFNEGWGQHNTNEILEMTQTLDPTRLVDGPSGWADRGWGDMKDLHRYPGPGMFPTDETRVSVLGEFGGLGLPIEGHTWVGSNNWGYRNYATREELNNSYANLLNQMPGLIADGLAAAIYTQTTDVEIEVNGLMTYDRAITKFDADRLARLHARLYEPPGRRHTVVPTSENEPQAWQFTTTKPADGWEQAGFDDRAWMAGAGGLGTKITPNTTVRTEWNTSDVWLRRTFTLDEAVSRPSLRLFHDEDAEVYINGTLVAQVEDYVVQYVELPLSDEAVKTLRIGENTIAVHCHQTTGGQYIDVGLIDLQKSAE